jgi:hypothetical protein
MTGWLVTRGLICPRYEIRPEPHAGITLALVISRRRVYRLEGIKSCQRKHRQRDRQLHALTAMWNSANWAGNLSIWAISGVGNGQFMSVRLHSWKTQCKPIRISIRINCNVRVTFCNFNSLYGNSEQTKTAARSHEGSNLRVTSARRPMSCVFSMETNCETNLSYLWQVPDDDRCKRQCLSRYYSVGVFVKDRLSDISCSWRACASSKSSPGRLQ